MKTRFYLKTNFEPVDKVLIPRFIIQWLWGSYNSFINYLTYQLMYTCFYVSRNVNSRAIMFIVLLCTTCLSAYVIIDFVGDIEISYTA